MRRKTILLIEDDEPIRGILRDILAKEYEIIEASGYSDAISHLGKHIDLAILDYSLQDKNGLEVLKTFREHKPSLPAIIITAFGHEALAIKAIRSEVDDYMKKPLNFSYLRSRLSEILNGKTHGEKVETEKAMDRKEFILDGITTYIRENYMEELTLDRIADMAGMSKSTFCKAFKERFGITFTSYLNDIRIKNAATLIMHTDSSITEIAHNVGYGSVTYFERVFKSKYGKSPIELRNQKT